jgi:hypothetical protein
MNLVWPPLVQMQMVLELQVTTCNLTKWTGAIHAKLKLYMWTV